MPSLEALLEFLTNRAHTLELIEGSAKIKQDTKSIAIKKSSKKVNVAAIQQSQCVYCDSLHHVSSCEQFQRLSVPEKREEIKRRQLCLNCLRKGHYMHSIHM